MVTHNLDAQHAIEFVQSQWPIADPNKGFVQQLHEFNIAAQQIAMSLQMSTSEQKQEQSFYSCRKCRTRLYMSLEVPLFITHAARKVWY